MKQNLAPIRPAMTAIAAVIALSSTPLLAQVADTTGAQSAPVVAAPPPAAEPAAPAVPAAVPDVAPAVQAASAEPAVKTMSTPVEHTVDTTAPSATTGAGEAAQVRREAAAPAARHASAAPRAAVTPAATPLTKTPVAKTAAPAPTVAEPAPAPAPAAPAPVAAVRSTNVQSSSTDATLPIAGAIGVGLLAIGGAYAMRRRRRDDDELVLDTPLETAPVVTAEPIIAPKAAAPATAAAATLSPAEGPDRLPNGFDLSRFGRHTRAAYLGPTPDNPSYSLRRRLKHASFFDQREREAAAAGSAPLKEPVYARSEAAQAAPADNGQITVRLSPERKRGPLGYILQR